MAAWELSAPAKTYLKESSADVNLFVLNELAAFDLARVIPDAQLRADPIARAELAAFLYAVSRVGAADFQPAPTRARAIQERNAIVTASVQLGECAWLHSQWARELACAVFRQICEDFDNDWIISIFGVVELPLVVMPLRRSSLFAGLQRVWSELVRATILPRNLLRFQRGQLPLRLSADSLFLYTPADHTTPRDGAEAALIANGPVGPIVRSRRFSRH